jgi:hypothetical protein
LRDAKLYGRVAAGVLSGIEVLILSALILMTRCANYRDVFVAGNVYFSDADCYARMTRVRLCAEHPGLIIRHHDFENYPTGTTPHTTAPLDYLILGLSILLGRFTSQPLDLAGALISPLFALLAGWFLWWWSRRMKFRYRWIALTLYGLSPILAHGTALGRPDHQSLLMLLITIAVCAEWTLQRESSKRWGIVAGCVWGMAMWVSAYEPLVLLVLAVALAYIHARRSVPDSQTGATRDAGPFAPHRRLGWICFVAIIAFALLIERRVPFMATVYSSAVFKNWSRTVGELKSVSPLAPIWFQWMGWLLIATPILAWWSYRKRSGPPILVLGLLAATYLLTVWQVRWAYFFVALFVIAFLALLEPLKSRLIIWVIFLLSIYPILRDWNERLWPNDSELGRRMEEQRENVDLRQLAITLQSSETHPFLTVWWLSPAISYWSHQPAVAGSSHESLAGVQQSARFFASQDWSNARVILENTKVTWVIAYDAARTAESCASILDEPASQHAVCYVLDRAPAQAPRFLAFAAQNPAGKLFRIGNNR